MRYLETDRKFYRDVVKIALQLMDALSLIVIFRSANSILTKGVLRGGGDTRFLVAADTLTMWCFAIPLGALAGLVLHLPAFWVFLPLHIDQIIKAVWCVFRLKSGKWVKTIHGAGGEPSQTKNSLCWKTSGGCFSRGVFDRRPFVTGIWPWRSSPGRCRRPFWRCGAGCPLRCSPC